MRNQSAQAMEMLLLAHKVALELTLLTQHQGYGLNPQISQREGWGDPLRLRVRNGLGLQQWH
jgi:hypothetical protein